MTHDEFQKRYQYDPAADRLGEGGFGKVFKAYDTHRDRWVAIKMAEAKPELDSVRLKKEVELVNKLASHPNIAYYEECYTFKSFAGEYDFGVLQFYEEGNLQQLADKKNLNIKQKESILTQLLYGIGFLHENGIIHRDLKPANILIVNRNGGYIPKITDFGISKKLDISNSSVFSNSLAGAGTLSFASPEQLGDRTIRKNTDLWSFGVIAFWLLTGKLPFTTGTHANTSEAGRAELFKQINSGKLPNSIEFMSLSWKTLIERCLVTEPDKRIMNVNQCLDVLSNTDQTQQKTIIEEKIITLKSAATPKLEQAQEHFAKQSIPNPSPQNTVYKRPIVIIAVLISVLMISLFAFFSKPDNNDKTSALKIANNNDSVSYALGVLIGENNKKQMVSAPGVNQLNKSIMIAGFKKAFTNDILQIDSAKANKMVQKFFSEISTDENSKNLKDGEQFLAANKSNPAVVTLPSGLQYEIIKTGAGPIPKVKDKVKCHYQGMTIDGKVFDSSVDRGEPAIFPVEKVIPGWTEALQLMPVGSKWKLFIPADLAYGERGAGQDIKPNSTLIFEVELLEIVK